MDCGEIADFDTFVLKVVLDIYDNAEKKNRELGEPYKDLRKIIENIYRRE